MHLAGCWPGCAIGVGDACGDLVGHLDTVELGFAVAVLRTLNNFSGVLI